MKVRCLATAILAIGIFASTGPALRAQGSITFTFGDQDRQAMRQWYGDHYSAPEFQNRSWNAQAEQGLRAGIILPQNMRGWARPAPQDLYDRLAPLPRNYRYLIVGDHVVAVDNQWVIYDVYHFERFQDADQQAMHDWYAGNSGARELDGRQRWNDQMEQRIQVGAALDRDLRRLARPAPDELVSRLPARPRYLRYVIVGDHVCLIDNQWVIRDVVHLERGGYRDYGRPGQPSGRYDSPPNSPNYDDRSGQDRGSYNRDQGGQGGRVPQWAVGTFHALNGDHYADLTIQPDGSVSIKNLTTGQITPSRYQDGVVVFSWGSFNIRPAGNNIEVAAQGTAKGLVYERVR